MANGVAQAGLLRIGELARQAGISVTTVKYYVKEGLVQPSCKTGPNMAYYDPACVERIRYIKTLQKERYYPLSVIRGLLERDRSFSREADLLDAIHKKDYRSGTETYPAGEALRQAGLTRSQAARLAQSGVIGGGRRHVYTDEELRVMQLVKRRLDAGMPLEHTVRAFAAYDAALGQAVAGDIDSFIRASFLENTSTESAIRLIRVSDETLDEYVCLRRAALNREYGSRQLALLEQFSAGLTAALDWLGRETLALGFPREAALLRQAPDPAAKEPLSAALYHYRLLPDSAGGEIMRRSMICGRACGYFTAPPEPAAGLSGLLAAALRLCFLTLAPPVLNCADALESARQQLKAAATALPETARAPLLAQLDALLASQRAAYE